mmetsp:Transcript_62007/g.110468  ORF Transcript_62007/g.110468 Transcript_62007/m.110468 type:complete len:92 (-) Transcript_62007:265-540(-)
MPTYTHPQSLIQKLHSASLLSMMWGYAGIMESQSAHAKHGNCTMHLGVSYVVMFPVGCSRQPQWFISRQIDPCVGTAWLVGFNSYCPSLPS